MQRLSEGAIELNSVEVFNNCSYSCYANLADALNKLAEYEDTGLTAGEIEYLKKELNKYKDLEKQGRLIKLPPVTEGKTLYWIWGNEIMPVICRGIDKGITYRMTTKRDRTFTKLDGTPFTYEKGDTRFFYAKDFGETVFFTKQEAENALKGEKSIE